MKIYEQLLECWNDGDLEFYNILADLSDAQIDEISEFCQDMPDKMRKLLVDFECKRNYFMNREYQK